MFDVHCGRELSRIDDSYMAMRRGCGCGTPAKFCITLTWMALELTVASAPRRILAHHTFSVLCDIRNARDMPLMVVLDAKKVLRSVPAERIPAPCREPDS